MKNLIVGSAGWRSPYGTSKKIISKLSLKSLVNYANQNNFKGIDTAPAYGDAEELILACHSKISIDTKLNPFTTISEFDDELNKLKHDSIHTLYFHDPDAAKKFSIEELNNFQTRIKDKGYKVGFSIYDIESLDRTYGQLKSDAIYQVPLNIFDLKFLKFIEERDILSTQIVFRSLFSRGLIFQNNKEIRGAFGKKFDKVKYNFENFYKLPFSRKSMESLTFSLINYISSRGHDVLIGLNNIQEIKLFIQNTRKSSGNTFQWSDLLKKSKTLSKIEELNL